MNYLPKARTTDIVMQQTADEILIYDRRDDQAYCLNSTAAFVWQNADGETPISEIARRLQKKYRTTVTEGVVWFALKTLKERNLLAGNFPLPAEYSLVSRRQLIDLLGKSAAVAIPLVFSITAPQAANASSPGSLRVSGTGCSSNSQCVTGNCVSGMCCANNGASCTGNSQCCSGFCASGGTCQTRPTGGSGGCVLYDTPITISDGKSMMAIDVSLGQELLGVNCFSGAMIAGRVKAKQELYAHEIYALTAESGDVIQCSPTHPLIAGFGDRDGTPIERFKIGDSLLVHDQHSNQIVEAKTVAVERIPIAQPVILFEMDTFEHTFISGGIISHNKIVCCEGSS